MAHNLLTMHKLWYIIMIMLVNFKVKNFRSFYDEVVFSMQATPNKEFAELNTFKAPERTLLNGENNLLKSAIIFGANSSGKSNLLKALKYMQFVVQFSNSPFQTLMANEPFLFLEKNEAEPTVFEIEFINKNNNTFYNYGFEIQNKKIIKEYLSKRTDGRIKDIFRRVNENMEYLSTDGIQKEIGFIQKVPQQILFISMAQNLIMQIAEDIKAVVQCFNELVVITQDDINGFDIYDENSLYHDKALEILKSADFGIDDFNIFKNKIAELNSLQNNIQFNIQSKIPPQIKKENAQIYHIDLDTKFNVYNIEGNPTGEVIEKYLNKDYGFNSDGTYRLMCFLGIILKALDKGGVVFIDEIDSKIHFVIADYLIKLFNSIDVNKNDAQLITTAHNILLMDGNLRRDQIYFTKKDKFGKTALYSLSDFNGVRKTDLFSKNYLAGFYDAIPNVGEDKI